MRYGCEARRAREVRAHECAKRSHAATDEEGGEEGQVPTERKRRHANSLSAQSNAAGAATVHSDAIDCETRNGIEQRKACTCTHV